MKIREAVMADIDEWVAMRSQLWPDSSAHHRIEIAEYFAGRSIDIVQAYVLDSGAGSIVGFIELNVRNFVEGSRNAKVPYVEAWFVGGTYRGRGLGRQLMQRAERWASELGFTELASDTEIDNKKSIQLHKALGFRETYRVVCFLKSLDGSE